MDNYELEDWESEYDASTSRATLLIRIILDIILLPVFNDMHLDHLVFFEADFVAFLEFYNRRAVLIIPLFFAQILVERRLGGGGAIFSCPWFCIVIKILVSGSFFIGNEFI